MSEVSQIIITIRGTVVASSGFWAYITKKLDKKDIKTKMILGLGHDRIVFLGLKYIERGYITNDEYENLYEYLFKPYKEMGGNGTAERIMGEVKKLPIMKNAA